MSRTFISLSLLVLAVIGGTVWLLQENGGIQSPSPTRPTKVSRTSDTHNFGKEMAIKSRWSGLTKDGLPAHQRLEIARQISDSLSKEDTAALFAAMDHTPRSGGEQDWYLILNEIMEQMRRHGLGSDQYATRLGNMITDSSRPEVVRDYAIQHLALWIAPGDSEQVVPHEKNPGLIQSSLNSIVKAIEDPTIALTSIPGTALLALANISPNLPEENAAATWKSLEAYLQGIISGDDSLHLSTRVSAIQAVSITGQQEFLPAIRLLAASQDTEPSIRLSSIASLGFYADSEDQTFLETLAAQNTQYKYAAQSALKRLAAQ